jgi:DNA-directed RNA polymerase specialized sigma24 family protein
MPSKKKYPEAETQAQREAVMGALERGLTIQQAAAAAEVPVGRARWLQREGVRLQHSTTQESVSTYPLPEV